MASSHADWDATFIPGTHILANKLDITDPSTLAETEYAISSIAQGEIEDGTVQIERSYDQRHLLAIHHHLFRDIYEWAGTVRTYPLWRNPVVPFADPELIPVYLDHAYQKIAQTEWEKLDHRQFSQAAATVYASVNFAHPSREGNGRAAKTFMTHLANDHGWDLDFDRVPARAWNQAAALSAPDRGTFEPVPDELFPVFERLTIIRTPAAPSTQPPHPTATELAARGPLSAGPDAPRGPQREASLPPRSSRTTRPPRRGHDERKRGGPMT
ncbi:Fic/DOC family protein [Gordonia liuliyuniae]|uniref:protein adenylyltransferase n=1 Tax=Gordonia liuliyuniae TaxID=2911517 RepID=A0ABS9IUD6_9ACTN|nr:Fic family protein [Gordonia liuliyuniae]MCF8589092.1 Fic family protein [Gordonia liuliyuniae]